MLTSTAQKIHGCPPSPQKYMAAFYIFQKNNQSFCRKYNKQRQTTKKKNTQHFKITNKNLVASLTDDNFHFTQRINRKHIYTRKKLTINTVCNFYIRFMKRQKDTSVLYGRWHQCFKVNESILEYCQHLQILVLCFHGVHQVNLTYITYPHSKSVLMILYIH